MRLDLISLSLSQNELRAQFLENAAEMLFKLVSWTAILFSDCSELKARVCHSDELH